MSSENEYLGQLTKLGGESSPSRELETFPNLNPGRNYTVSLSTDEFTCLCPKTKQPDFASISIEYVPEDRILESKSLKLYLWSFRNEGVFHEHLANMILDDLVRVLEPRWCRVSADFGIRGGISISVDAEYGTDPRS